MKPPPVGRNEIPSVVQAREGFGRPLAALGTTPVRALVLGAGVGNDVAALLARGIPSIDAVEIDPVILGLGRGRNIRTGRTKIPGSDVLPKTPVPF